MVNTHVAVAGVVAEEVDAAARMVGFLQLKALVVVAGEDKRPAACHTG